MSVQTMSEATAVVAWLMHGTTPVLEIEYRVEDGIHYSQAIDFDLVAAADSEPEAARKMGGLLLEYAAHLVRLDDEGVITEREAEELRMLGERLLPVLVHRTQARPIDHLFHRKRERRWDFRPFGPGVSRAVCSA